MARSYRFILNASSFQIEFLIKFIDSYSISASLLSLVILSSRLVKPATSECNLWRVSQYKIIFFILWVSDKVVKKQIQQIAHGFETRWIALHRGDSQRFL